MSLPNFTTDADINPDAGLASIDMSTVYHQFKFCYSKTKDFPAGKSITCPPFFVAGYPCKIRFYPQGTEDEPNYLTLHLVFKCNSEVTASFAYSILDKYGRPSNIYDLLIFKFSPECEGYGIKSETKRSDLEDEFVECVKDDYFTLACSVTILNDSLKEVPNHLVNGIMPFCITEDVSELLETEEMADIAFEVDGEIFNAHKLILSARSPVFKAELFGDMAKSKVKKIHLRDIKPVVFEALLHFIYTDSVPQNVTNGDTPVVTLVQNLLEAADKYALVGLRFLCEELLVREISLDTVVSLLALSEEHNCSDLRVACVHFASEHEILVKLALKSEYVQLMQRYPSLLESLNEDVDFRNLISKKQRLN